MDMEEVCTKVGETIVNLYGSGGKLEFGQFQYFVSDVTGKMDPTGMCAC